MSQIEIQHPQLSAEELEAFRERLLEMRRELLAEERPLGATGGERGPGDEGDLANRELTTEITLQLGEQDRERLMEIDEALARIDAGTYGLCEETEEPIPYVRLEAIPTARYTVAVQEELESAAGLEAPTM